MNTKKEDATLQKNNFLQNQSRAKKLIEHEKEEKEKQQQKFSNLFKVSSKKDLFESVATAMLNQDKHIGPSVDFLYHKLNVEFLAKSGITLEKNYTQLLASDSCARIVYIEYYIDYKNSCIIFVKYHFKHIRLCANEGKTDLYTYAFVNNKSEVYYYDNFSNCQLLKRASFTPTVSDARKLLENKVFEVEISQSRTFSLVSSTDSSVFEDKAISDIHLLPKQLMDILLEQYKGSPVPSKSQIRIETTFLGVSDTPTTVQTKVKVNYKYSGVIQTTEKLLEYEIVLYFLDFPEKKVKARFYLTEAEKEQKLTLADISSDAIVFESVNEKFERDSLYYKGLFKKQLSEKNLSELTKAVFENSCICSSFYNFPLLEDTFKGIYAEHFKVNHENIPKRLHFEQIRDYQLEYDNKQLWESVIYSATYKGNIYLVKVYARYLAYSYYDSSVVVYFPAFSIKDLNIKIYKPASEKDFDLFLADSSSSELNGNSFEYSSGYEFAITRDTHIVRSFWKETFSDFVIRTEGKQESYKIVRTENDVIYKKVLDCIKTPKTEISSFNFSTFYPFGYDDDEQAKTRIPFVSSGLTYGAYFDDGFNKISVNSPLKENCKYSYSSGDELLEIIFDTEVPYYQTTLYGLFERYQSFSRRDAEIKDSQYLSIGENNFWNTCINFLLSISNEDFFK